MQYLQPIFSLSLRQYNHQNQKSEIDTFPIARLHWSLNCANNIFVAKESSPGLYIAFSCQVYIFSFILCFIFMALLLLKITHHLLYIVIRQLDSEIVKKTEHSLDCQVRRIAKLIREKTERFGEHFQIQTSLWSSVEETQFSLLFISGFNPIMSKMKNLTYKTYLKDN